MITQEIRLLPRAFFIMEILITAIYTVAFVAYIAYSEHQHRKQVDAMVDRLMSRDIQEYKAFQPELEEEEAEPVVDDIRSLDDDEVMEAIMKEVNAGAN